MDIYWYIVLHFLWWFGLFVLYQYTDVLMYIFLEKMTCINRCKFCMYFLEKKMTCIIRCMFTCMRSLKTILMKKISIAICSFFQYQSLNNREFIFSKWNFIAYKSTISVWNWSNSVNIESSLWILMAHALATGPCLTTAIWRCRNPFSQWQRSFQRKLRSHWLKFLQQRHVAAVRQGPGHQ